MVRTSVVALLLASTVQAQANLAAVSDSVFARWNSTHGPGCAVGVAREGKTLLTKGYGMANLETGTPITGETVFESGSVAKQFTATAVLLLAMDGKLDLSDPVRKHLPEFPQYDRVITVRHLLTHTSGIYDFASDAYDASIPSGFTAACHEDPGRRSHLDEDTQDHSQQSRYQRRLPQVRQHAWSSSGFHARSVTHRSAALGDLRTSSVNGCDAPRELRMSCGASAVDRRRTRVPGGRRSARSGTRCAGRAA